MTQMQKVTSTSPSGVGPSISLRMRPNVPVAKTRSLEAIIGAITPTVLPSGVLILSPGRPRMGENYLRFHQPMMVTSEPGQDFALFDSAYSDFSFPDVQVTFTPIKAGKSHLVEFHIQLFQDTTYKFRKFSYPTGDTEDMSDDQTSLISILVPAVSSDISYGAEIMQLNEPTEDAGWLLKYVRITAMD